MNKSIVFGVLLAGVISMPLMLAGPAFAQYGSQYGGEDTATGAFGSLEEQLELAKRKVDAAESNPATGSGTPYLDADGIFGASAIAGGIFGGIAAAFLIRGRSGRYAAYGRG
jgi:hypothetical protein|tara:strand:- start:33 stop:368 length:336 start_codon:yes stop_codon:yes gene_type:complete